MPQNHQCLKKKKKTKECLRNCHRKEGPKET